MKFISSPNIPEKRVTLFISAADIPASTVIPPAPLKKLPSALQHHADLGICVVSSKKAVCPPDSYEYYSEKLSPYGFEIIKGKNSLDCHYPGDSAYNVCIVGKKCFLNKNVCDEALLDILTSVGYEIINVKQGYTKCSICPIDENSIITADASISIAAKEQGMDVLLITNRGIKLPGYDNGFFGGCTGLYDKHTLLLNGEIKYLPESDAVKVFLNKKGISIKELKKGPVTDIGSILPLMI